MPKRIESHLLFLTDDVVLCSRDAPLALPTFTTCDGSGITAFQLSGVSICLDGKIDTLLEEPDTLAGPILITDEVTTPVHFCFTDYAASISTQ